MAGLEGYSRQIFWLSLAVGLGLAIVGSLVGDIVGDFLGYSVGLGDVHVAVAGFVDCRLDICGNLALVIFFFSRLCRCRVRGVSGWLVQISTFLFGF